MYFRELADLTRLHWSDHLRDYLDEQEPLKGVKLQTPVKFTTSSYVGGIWHQKNTPYYAIDCLRKELSDTGEGLNTYLYSGQITGVIGARNADQSDLVVSGHQAAAEKFISEHLYLADTNDGFKLLAFALTEAEFSGAIQAVKDPKNSFWVHAFRIGLSWLVSEDSARQHDV